MVVENGGGFSGFMQYYIEGWCGNWDRFIKNNKIRVFLIE